MSLVQYLWERPCVAMGRKAAPMTATMFYQSFTLTTRPAFSPALPRVARQ